jgi:hypothetical protein
LVNLGKSLFTNLLTHRCGNKAYADLFGNLTRQNKVYRFVNSYDIIPRVPVFPQQTKCAKKLSGDLYVHHGTLIWIDMDYNLKPVANSQVANYEGVNFFLGVWEGFEKFIRGVQRLESFPMLCCRLMFPYAVNDHLPAEYLYALQYNAAQPANSINQVAPLEYFLFSDCTNNEKSDRTLCQSSFIFLILHCL